MTPASPYAARPWQRHYDYWVRQDLSYPGRSLSDILNLSAVERRCALSHEIAHVDLGHRHSGHLWFDDHQEREANTLAARRLIDIDALADAFSVTRDDRALGELLNVVVAVVHTRFAHLHPSERHYLEARIARIEHVA